VIRELKKHLRCLLNIWWNSYSFNYDGKDIGMTLNFRARYIFVVLWSCLLVTSGAFSFPTEVGAPGGELTYGGEIAVGTQDQQMTIEIRSLPSGADIYLDRELKGKTPLQIPGVSFGPHGLLLKLEGHFDHSTTIQVKRDKKDPFMYQLSRPAVLIVTSNVPQAEVFIDDIYYGRAPFEQQFQPGELRVRVSKSGYRDTSMAVNFAEGDRREFKVELTSLIARGSIRVTTSPADAEVYLNGKYVGKSPILIPDVLMGSNIILVRKVGFPEREQTVTVSRESGQAVDFDLLGARTPAAQQAEKKPAPPEVAPPLAHLQISVEPADATVTVDGKAANPGLNDLKAGRHIVRVTRSGFDNDEQTVDLTPGQTKQLPITLSRASSTSWLWYVAGAAVVGGTAYYFITQGKTVEPSPTQPNYGSPPGFPVNPRVDSR